MDNAQTEVKKYYDKYGRELAFDGHGLLTDTTYGTKYFITADGNVSELKSPLDGSPIHIDDRGRYVSDYSNAIFDVNANGRIVPLVDPISNTGTAHIENNQLVSDVTGERYDIDPNGNVMTAQEVLNQNRQQELINNWNQRDIDGTIDQRLDQISQTIKQPTQLSQENIKDIFDIPQANIPVINMPAKPIEQEVIPVKPEELQPIPTEVVAPLEPVALDMSAVSNFDINGTGYVKMEQADGKVEVIRDTSPLSIKEQFSQAQMNNLGAQTNDGKANAMEVFNGLKLYKKQIQYLSNVDINRGVLNKDERVSLAAITKTNGQDEVYGNVQEGIFIDQNKGNAVLTTEQKGNRVEVQGVAEHDHITSETVERPLEISETLGSNELEKDLRIVDREEQKRRLLEARAELVAPPVEARDQSLEKSNEKVKRLVPPFRMMMDTNGEVDAVLITIMTSILVVLLCGVLNFVK